ncbi:MAG: hypothetical protein AB1728_08195 [Bacteroidota bacterium]
MTGKWIEIVSLKLTGDRFNDHSVTLDSLSTLIEYQTLVSETAKSLYKKKFPNRERLPKNFEEKTILRFNRIEDGSASVPLEAYFEESEQDDFFIEKPIIEAVDITKKAIAGIKSDKPFPEDLPKNIIPFIAKLGSSLKENESIKIQVKNQPEVNYTSEERDKIIKFIDRGYEDAVEISGKVGEVNVVKQSFQLYVNEKENYTIAYSSELEDLITSALKEHRSKKVKIKGRGEYNIQGVLKKILQLDDVIEVKKEDTENQILYPSIVDELLSIIKDAPPEEIEKLPSDFASNHDRYLYKISLQ